MIKIILSVVGFVVFLTLAGVGAAVYGLYTFGRGLPDYKQLAVHEPATVTRVHAGNGVLLAEYATENRVFVPIQAIPRRVINAFLSAEDKNFYSHPGVDALSVVRAALTNLVNMGQNKRLVGASTITQQVAKNFLLSNEVSYKRKIREAILAFRIETTFSKDRILELYLNEIYLGFGSYGVAAAALNYFNKALDELTVAEAAFLAALPKAPNNYHPHREHEAAVGRRDWVIGRMVEDGHVTEAEALVARAAPLKTRARDVTQITQAKYFAEEVRRELVRLYGQDRLYRGGLSVRTTLDPQLQEIAEASLRQGLIAYDRRHGWRGAVAKLDLSDGNWQDQLAGVEPPAAVGDWQLAVVLATDSEGAKIGLAQGAPTEGAPTEGAPTEGVLPTEGTIPMAELKWARPWLEGQKVGARPKQPGEVFQVGDVVLVEPVAADGEGKAYPEHRYGLRQIPDVGGAILALDPHTGRVLAMVGGFSYEESEFNRAVQAYRQPGSAFKPMVYLAAMDSGFTPATLVLDAPFVIDQGAGLGKWKPANYSNKFYGPTPLRIGLEKSRNLMTVRLAQTIGMDKVVDYAGRFGVIEDMAPTLSMALGAGETTLLKLTTAYAMLVNGGLKVTPTLIDRVQDHLGRTIFRHDTRPCEACRVGAWQDQAVPQIADVRERIADAGHAYQVVSMLQGVVQRGTGRRIASLGKPLAGKTGTTNDNQDTWFVGFSSDLAVGVFVGFDEPKTLGRKQTGSNVAAPIFKAFMAKALETRPAAPFRIPPDLRLVRINLASGQIARPGDKQVILEAFMPGTEPNGEQTVIGGAYTPRPSAGAEVGAGPRTGVGPKVAVGAAALDAGGLY